MLRKALIQVDAFTLEPYAGNPCAVVLEADDLSEQTMQKIALEMNLSETAFVMTSEKADFRARYFTPAFEIPLAGHPTIATIYTLLNEGGISLDNGRALIQLELQAGVIPIEVAKKQDNYWITMSQVQPEFLRSYHAEDVLPAFNLHISDLMPGCRPMTVSTGTPQLMVPLCSLESLEKASLNLEKYKFLLQQGDFVSPHLFVTQGVSEGGDTFARHFGLPPDTYEDPFTGSATGGMGAYLWHHGLIPSPGFIAEQGHWLGRPGQAKVEVVGPPNAIQTVKISGSAVEVMRGEIIIPEI